MAVLKPFRFWVQNVLPQVYDDSLSYYELLNKVVVYLNNTIDEVNKISGELEALENYVVNYFDNADFQAMVDQKLDEMAEDGTLDALINMPQMLVPSDEDKEKYKSDTLACVASWLVNEIGSNSVANPSEVVQTTDGYYGCYDDNGKAYISLFERGYTDSFTYADKHNDKPVVYMQCSGFLNMITRCRKYEDSPNYYAINANPYVEADALKKCWEAGTYNNKPWTIDFMNEVATWKMAYTMDKSGCTALLLRPKTGDVNQLILNQMETGDLIFYGNPTRYPNRYKGMYHCGYYIKDIEDLNEAGEAYNAKFEAVPRSSHNSTEMGYMAHCTSGLADEYTDSIRIDTLDYILWANHNLSDIYVCKPYSNALNSNKANRSNVGMFITGDDVYFTTKDPVADSNPAENLVYELDTGAVKMNNPRIRSIFTSVGNLSNLRDGFYTVSDWNTAENKPAASTASSAVVWQFGSTNQYHGVQVVFDTNGFVFFRIKPLTDYWGDWHTLFDNT